VSAENLPALGLVVVGAWGIVVATRTLKTMKLQTDVLANSERAWVMVDLEKVPGMGGVQEGTSYEPGSGQFSSHINAYVRCICSNHGQTPARIIEKRCCLKVFDSEDEVPRTPDLDIDVKDPVPHYLGVGKEPSKHDWWVTGEGMEFPGHAVIIYGVVKYQHLFSEQVVQTTFGYRITDDHRLERLTNRPKYNANT